MNKCKRSKQDPWQALLKMDEHLCRYISIHRLQSEVNFHFQGHPLWLKVGDLLEFMASDASLVGSSVSGGWRAHALHSSEQVHSDYDLILLIMLYEKMRDVGIPVQTKPGFYTVKNEATLTLPKPVRDFLVTYFKDFKDLPVQMTGQQFSLFLRAIAPLRQELQYQPLQQTVDLDEEVFCITSDVLITTRGPALCVCIKIKDRISSIEDIMVNLVPCIKLMKWPEMVAHNWGNRKRRWPSKPIVQEILEAPCHLVSKPQMNSNPDAVNPSELRLTFPEAEVVLTSHCSRQQHMVYIIAKAIFCRYLSIEVCGRKIPSYFLKTTWMWMMEKTNPKMWTDVNREMLVMDLLKKMEGDLTAKHLPYYFIPAVNLLAEYPTDLTEHATENLTEVINSFPNCIPSDDEVNRAISKNCNSLEFWKSVYPHLYVWMSTDGINMFINGLTLYFGILMITSVIVHKLLPEYASLIAPCCQFPLFYIGSRRDFFFQNLHSKIVPCVNAFRNSCPISTFCLVILLLVYFLSRPILPFINAYPNHCSLHTVADAMNTYHNPHALAAIYFCRSLTQIPNFAPSTT